VITLNATPVHPKPLTSSVRGRAWFYLASSAFKRSFPEVANQVPVDDFCVCPICVRAFGVQALEARFLTREHAPPESVGGNRLVLTCRDCNVGAGHQIDSHMRREADVMDFAAGQLKEIKAGLVTKCGSVPIRLSASGSGLLMLGLPHATRPEVHASVMGQFEAATKAKDERRVDFRIHFAPFSANRARVSWLRSAYLVFFAALGYRFICRPELDPVRAKIRSPESDDGPRTFRLILDKAREPTLIRIDEPEVLRSYAMIYRRNVIFLPRANDHTLYARLAEHPSTAHFSGKQYPWPLDGPTFFYDR
jgi:hypothetical protein